MNLFDKSFKKLPNVKNLVGKIMLVEGMQKYLDIPLPNFDNVFEPIKNKKHFFSRKVQTCTQSRLEEEEDDSKFLFTHIVHILDTAGWIRETNDEDGTVIRDEEFGDDVI